MNSSVTKVVLDSNIFVSAFVFSGNPALIFDLAVDKKIILVTSPEIINETVQVLDRKFKWDSRTIKRQVKVINDVSLIVIPKIRVKKLSYQKDNKVLEVALEGEVNYIITGDKKHLLPLKEFKGVPILTPMNFLETWNK